MKWKTSILALTLLTSVIHDLVWPAEIFSQSSSFVNASIRISICGNFIAEGGEQCDNLDLNGGTCRSLGFDTGDLSCDMACDYNTSLCTGVAPTPTPTPTQILTPTPTQITPTPTLVVSISSDPLNQSISDDSVSQTVSTNNNLNLNLPSLIDALLDTGGGPTLNSVLPLYIKYFDLNNSGKIETDTLRDVLEIWVSEWRNTDLPVTEKNCDLNADGLCDLADLSILLYYVNR